MEIGKGKSSALPLKLLFFSATVLFSLIAAIPSTPLQVKSLPVSYLRKQFSRFDVSSPKISFSSGAFRQVSLVGGGSVRQGSSSEISLGRLLGTWNLLTQQNSDTGCPQTLTFTRQRTESGTLDDGTPFLAYPGAGLVIDGSRCSSGAAFGIISARNGLGLVLTGTAQCGTFQLSQRALPIFQVRDDVRAESQNGEVVANRDFLLAISPSQEVLCTYIQGEVHGGGNGPSNPTSSPTVSRDPDEESDGTNQSPPPVQPGPVSGPGQGNGTEDDKKECFPGNVMVDVEGVGEVLMKSLKIGDRVRVAAGIYSDIVLFTHRDEKHYGKYVEIEVEDGRSLRLTGGHYLYVNNKLAPARSVKSGDTLRDGSTEDTGATLSVKNVKSVVDTGLYNPQTMHGDIVVNGIVSSTFTTAIEPSVARILMKPVSSLYKMGWISEFSAGSLFKYGASLK